MDTVRLEFKTPELNAAIKPSCERVLAKFKLPPFRLLCFFDNENPVEFDWLGTFYCGFHVPVVASGAMPTYMDNFLFDSMGGGCL
jgi:hypothetical protein